MQAHNEKHVFGLDLMRAVAIVLVVFSSVYFIVPNLQGAISQLMSIAGVVGVEIFFVLSGFLVGSRFYKLYLKKDFGFKTIKQFWIKRWFRILPNYVLALIMSILVTLYIGHNLPSDLWKYVLFFQNFESDTSSGFFYESWSISVGEFAALLGPLLLYLMLFVKTKISKQKLFLLVTLLVILIFLVSKYLYSINDDVKTMVAWSRNLKTAVIYRIDAVYYGVLVAYVSIVRPKFWVKTKYVMLVFSIVLFFVLHILLAKNYWYINTHPTLWNVWYLSLNSIAIALMLPLLSQWKSSPKVMSKPVRFLSSIAYAVFVIHYSIVLRLLLYKIPSENLPRFDSLVFIMIYLSMLILLGYLINRFFEKPISAIKNSTK